jgi:hypothetical protein
MPSDSGKIYSPQLYKNQQFKEIFLQKVNQNRRFLHLNLPFKYNLSRWSQNKNLQLVAKIF